LPEPGPHDPRLTLEHEIILPPKRPTTPEWIKQQNSSPARCACGCEGAISVRPRHRFKGLPRFLPGHHDSAMARDVRALRSKALMTLTEVAAMLGISATTLRRLEGTIYGPVPRVGHRAMRALSAADVDLLRRWLATRHGDQPPETAAEVKSNPNPPGALRAPTDGRSRQGNRRPPRPANRTETPPRKEGRRPPSLT
jgi:hypothetical protein